MNDSRSPSRQPNGSSIIGKWKQSANGRRELASVPADPGVDVLRVIDQRPTDIAKSYGAPRHFKHPLQGHARLRHHLGAELDPGLKVAQGDVQFLKRI